jgi:hypothetical protein
MATSARTAVPGWYWAVSVAALLWAAAGCFAYLTQVSMDAGDLAKLPAAQREIWTMMPAWATAAYAVAVWAGLAGAVGLLLRRRWARTAYAVSLAAVVVQFGWTFLASPILSTVGPSAAVFPAFIALVGAALLWFSNYAARSAALVHRTP